MASGEDETVCCIELQSTVLTCKAEQEDNAVERNEDGFEKWTVGRTAVSQAIISWHRGVVVVYFSR